MHSGISQPDVDDLAQEVWALLVRRLPKLRLDSEIGTLHGWVAVVARHRAERYNRRRLKRRHKTLTPELASTLLDPAISPAASMEQEQQQSVVVAAAAEVSVKMPALKQRIIFEYWVEEQPISAIALILNTSEEFVWTTVRRSRPAMLRCLRRAGLAIDHERKLEKIGNT